MRTLSLLAFLILQAVPHEDVLFERMKAAFRAGQVDSAIALGVQAVKADPNRSTLHHWLGRAYGQKARLAFLLGQLPWASKCQREFETSVRLDPANTDAGLDLLQFYVLAPGLAGGSREKAHDLAPRIGEPGSGRRFLAQAIVLDLDRKNVEAEAAFRIALEKAPDDDRILAALVNFYGSRKRFRDGIELCRRSLVTRPENFLPNYLIGKLVSLWGEERELGLSALDRFLEKPPPRDGPNWGDAHYRKGVILLSSGNRDEARTEFQKALAIDPANVGARSELKKLS